MNNNLSGILSVSQQYPISDSNNIDHPDGETHPSKKIKLEHLQPAHRGSTTPQVAQSNQSLFDKVMSLPINIQDYLEPSEISHLTKTHKAGLENTKQYVNLQKTILRNEIQPRNPSFESHNNDRSPQFNLSDNQQQTLLTMLESSLNANQGESITAINQIRAKLPIEHIWLALQGTIESHINTFASNDHTQTELTNIRNQLNIIGEEGFDDFNDVQLIAQGALYHLTNSNDSEPLFKQYHNALSDLITEHAVIDDKPFPISDIEQKRLIYRSLTEIGADAMEENPSLNYSEPLLWEANNKEDVDLMKMLIEEGVDIDCEDFVDVDFSMLYKECRTSGNVDVIKRLISLGADVTIGSQGTDTCLSNAVTHGHIDAARLLLENGASVDDLTYDGLTLEQQANQIEDETKKTALLVLLAEHGGLTPIPI